MRKFVIAAAAAGAALTLSACSEGTEEAATDAVDGAVADMETNADDAGEAVEGAMEDGMETAGEAMEEVAE